MTAIIITRSLNCAQCSSGNMRNKVEECYIQMHSVLPYLYALFRGITAAVKATASTT